MKSKSLIVLVYICLLLSSCSVLEREDEIYESKSREVDSVFDGINVPNKEERERLALENETDNNVTATNDEVANEAKPNKVFEDEDEDTPTNQDDPNYNQTTDNQDQEDTERSTSTYLNLRSEMILNKRNVLITIPEGRSVELLEDNLGDDQTWSRILYDGQEGYVKSEYLLEQ